jgi:hypothetical protein
MHFTAETSSNGVVERNFTLGEVTEADSATRFFARHLSRVDKSPA